MPGYLVNPVLNAASISITPISGMSSGNVQSAINELVNKDISISAKSINVYLDSSARSTAMPSPTAGQVTYLTSTNSLEVYNGSSWAAVSTPNDYNLVVAQRMFTE